MSLLDWQNLHFAEPEKLLFLYVAATLFLLSLMTWFLKLSLRPKRTHGSRYPFFGKMKFWISLTIVLALCIIAYARPFLTEGRTVVTRGSAEIVFVVDYSFSMFLKDTGWSRIDIASREIMNSLSGGIIKEGDRAAILIFGKMVSPRLLLTRDIGALATEADKVGRPNTLLNNDLFWGSAIATTFKRVREVLDRQDMFAEFHKESKNWRPKPIQNRVVIVLSDGDFFNYGDEEGGKERIESEKKSLGIELQEFKKRNIPVYSVGIGIRSETKLLDVLRDYKKGEEYDPKLEEELRGQVSRLNMINLDNISRVTGGKSFSIEDFRSDAGGFIKASIDRHRSVSVESVPREEREELWLYFLLACLAVFILGMVVTKF